MFCNSFQPQSFAQGDAFSNFGVQVQNGPDTVEIFVDQTLPLPPGEAFRSIGRVSLKKGLETTLTLRNAGTEGFVILDALQLLPTP